MLHSSLSDFCKSAYFEDYFKSSFCDSPCNISAKRQIICFRCCSLNVSPCIVFFPEQSQKFGGSSIRFKESTGIFKSSIKVLSVVSSRKAPYSNTGLAFFNFAVVVFFLNFFSIYTE